MNIKMHCYFQQKNKYENMKRAKGGQLYTKKSHQQGHKRKII